MGYKPGPRPFPKTSARTQFLRIPRVDWARITQGLKTEFRAVGRHATLANRLRPGPIVCYAYREYIEDAQSALMVLDEVWREPLGAISAESLEREGFASLKEFRRYWRTRHQQAGFRPLTTVNVYRLRAWQPEDDRDQADALLHHLYGSWLGAAA